MVKLQKAVARDGDGVSVHVSAESIARRYQLEYLRNAKEGNIIICLDTGCGKTLIAVLLLKATSYLFSASTPYISVFLVPTVMLVEQSSNEVSLLIEQQANAIMERSDLKVGQYNGNNDGVKLDLQSWKEVINDREVLVMTPQILLNVLRHAFIKMETIKVLIFDECHHCQKGHPYARIMEEYYFKTNESDRPKILGMTASPVIRKGRSQLHCSEDINSLECLLDAKVITIQDSGELEKFVPSPNIEVKEYVRVYNSYDELKSIMQSLKSIMLKACLSENANKKESTKNKKRKEVSIQKIFRDVEYCIYELGVWFAKHAVEHAFCSDIEESLNSPENYEIVPQFEMKLFLRDISRCLTQALGQSGDMESLGIESLKPDIFSTKVISLVMILLEIRDPKVKCIVFVERVVAAKVLANFLSRVFRSMRCDYIVGSHSKTGRSSSKSIARTLDEFRSGMVDLIVATNVAEEGLDIQDCNIVIQFDMPKTLRSYIQARGRARVPASQYVILKDKTNFSEDKLLQTLSDSEYFLKERISNGNKSSIVSKQKVVDVDSGIYEVARTGAIVNLNSSIPLLYHYCCKLPSDQFYSPLPQFSYMEDQTGIRCIILLPPNAAIRKVVGEPSESNTAAKKLACLEACRILHLKGLLTDHLLPQSHIVSEDLDVHCNQDFLNHTSVYLRESFVPAVWLRKTSSSSSPTCFHAYSLTFVVKNQEYSKLALLFPSALPEEVSHFELNLQLHHRKTALCKLEPLKKIVLDESQVARAEVFQSTLFSILIDRNLESLNSMSLHSPDGCWYLVLPLIQSGKSQDNEIDWEKVSELPSGKDLKDPLGLSIDASTGAHLQLATEKVRVRDVPGLLVKTRWNENLYYVIDILKDINAHCPFPEAEYKSYSDYFKSKYNYEIQHAEQPLLKARFLKETRNLMQVKPSESGTANVREGPLEHDKSIVELPPEICHILCCGVYDDLVNSCIIVPSFMHKLESILLAAELRDFFSSQFSEGSCVSVEKILQALTTQRCMEPFSLERLELLGDSFLKYAVTCHLFLNHDEADEGILSRQRIKQICNLSLFVLGKGHRLDGFIHDELFHPKNWVSPCHTSTIVCDENTLIDLHGEPNKQREGVVGVNVCNKRHRWIKKKTVADVVEALIGAYLEDGGESAALAFMNFIGISVSIDSLQKLKVQTLSQESLFPSARVNIQLVEKQLSHTFMYKGLIVEAFTHASYFAPVGKCYQRLEFLGDSVLDYLITRYLYRMYDNSKPGELSDRRSSIVSNESFARITVKNKFYKHLIHNSEELSRCINEFVHYISTCIGTEEIGGWDGDKCPKVLGDILESLVGAVFVDGGFDLELVWKVFSPLLEQVISRQIVKLHPVRELQELCHKNQFKLEKHFSFDCYMKFEFTVEIPVINLTVTGVATSRDKITAKRQAAVDMLVKLNGLGYVHGKNMEILVNNTKIGSDNTRLFAGSVPNEKQADCDALYTSGDNSMSIPDEATTETKKRSMGVEQNGWRSSLQEPKISIPLECPDILDSEDRGIDGATSSFLDGATSFDSEVAAGSEENGMADINIWDSLGMMPESSTLPKHEQDVLRMMTHSKSSSSTPGSEENGITDSLGTMRECSRLPQEVDAVGMKPNRRNKISVQGDVNDAGQDRASLYELCAKKKLKHPTFKCTSEEGPAHNKQFTYAVTLLLPGVGCIECCGYPRKTKNAGMDSAAGELLTWLKSEGHA